MAKKKSGKGKAARKSSRKRGGKRPSRTRASKKASTKKASKKAAGKASKKTTSRKKASGKKASKKKASKKKASKTARPTSRSSSVKKGRKTGGGTAGRSKPARQATVRRGKAFFEHFRKRLLEERERIGQRLDDLREELSGLQEMPRELEEWAQEEKDRDILIRLEEREATELRRIQAALERIDDGSYGLCQICGRTIPKDRLEELPTAFRCIDHTG